MVTIERGGEKKPSERRREVVRWKASAWRNDRDRAARGGDKTMSAFAHRVSRASANNLRTACQPQLTGTLASVSEGWRRRPDLNRGWRFCRPLPYLLATAPRYAVRRVTGPATLLAHGAEWASSPTQRSVRVRRVGAAGVKNGAGNGIRTRDFDLGKVALYH